MDTRNDKKYIRLNKYIVLVVVLVIAAGILGWFIGRDDTSSSVGQGTNESTVTEDNTGDGIKSLVSYTLPDGWKEARCDEAPEAVYFVPAGAAGVDCGAFPSAAVKLSVDPESNDDCNDLQDVREVRKHVCVSLFINDHRSLQASTEYLASSSYKTETTIDAYYIDIGEEIIKVEHVYRSADSYGAGFDQLAKSIKSKN